MNWKIKNIQVGKNFFVREICDAWRGSALGFSVRTVVLASILGSPVQGELDFCAQRAQKDWGVVSATSDSVYTKQDTHLFNWERNLKQRV